MHNKKRKSIASILGLSVRTIDSYMETAKAKLNCRSQRELLERLPQTDFLQNIKKLNLARYKENDLFY